MALSIRTAFYFSGLKKRRGKILHLSAISISLPPCPRWLLGNIKWQHISNMENSTTSVRIWKRIPWRATAAFHTGQNGTESMSQIQLGNVNDFLFLFLT